MSDTKALADSIVSELERRLKNPDQIKYLIGAVNTASGSTVGVAYQGSQQIQPGVRLPDGVEVHRGSLVRVAIHPDGSAFITEVF